MPGIQRFWNVQLSHSLRTGPSPHAPEMGHLIPAWRAVPSSLGAGFIDLFILMGAGREGEMGKC